MAANQAMDADDADMLHADDALEEFEAGDDPDGDAAMDSDDDGDADAEGEEITLHNDSIAYFDGHKDSVFAIAQHPRVPSLVATGGSEGDADDAPGKGYIIDTSAAQGRPVLPASYSADPAGDAARAHTSLSPAFVIDGHTDSINALAFSLPDGRFLASGGLDGRLRVYAVAASANPETTPHKFAFVGEAQEVPEVNWLSPCPSPAHANSFALGASDGSVWVYVINPRNKAAPLEIAQSYFLHTAPSTAGAWTPDGNLLATVAEDSSLYVWDVWGEAAARNLVGDNGQTVVSLTGADQRFVVEGGLYSVAVEPRGTYLATGGAGGQIRVVSLPRLANNNNPEQASGKKSGGKAAEATAGGQILAALQGQSDSVETLAFSTPSTTSSGPAAQNAVLLAAGSVDGSITVFDASRRFAVRRNLPGAHEEYSVVKLEFVPGTWLLTSCGMDGVVRRWDLRGATATSSGSGMTTTATGADASGLVKEWRGHRGDGEGGGVLGFVQGQTGERVVTAGDDGLVLVFEA